MTSTLTASGPLAENTGACPRCGEWAMMTPLGVNALSRLSREPDDDSIWICSDCGTDEALEQHFCARITPLWEWPMPFRTFGQQIKTMRMSYSAMVFREEEDDG